LLQRDFDIGLCLCIINELDKIKYSESTNATKRRVLELVKKIGASKDKILNNLTFVIYNPTELKDILQKRNLDQNDKDDVFIGSVLCFMEKNPTIKVNIISNDLGVQLKCDAYKIPFI